ncbi:hypothetical protein M0R45_020020 [Rubus argutus]|uniref:Uncharacterized protein n=1 Tax=Rubus argutus TaxID=59490 RepID=A0AAW1X758_RUBAR
MGMGAGPGTPYCPSSLGGYPGKDRTESVGPIQCHGVALLASIDVDSSLFGIMEEGSFKTDSRYRGVGAVDPSDLNMYIYSFLDKMHV